MTARNPMLAGELYRPSNGEEGDIFCSEFCFQCERMGPDDERGCDILARSFNEKDDPEYPTEWRYDATGNPVCAAFRPKRIAEDAAQQAEEPDNAVDLWLLGRGERPSDGAIWYKLCGLANEWYLNHGYDVLRSEILDQIIRLAERLKEQP